MHPLLAIAFWRARPANRMTLDGMSGRPRRKAGKTAGKRRTAAFCRPATGRL